MTLSVSRIHRAAGPCKACGAPGTCHVQGVTYGFGTTWWRLCDRCAERASNPSPCERCKKDADELRPTYDWEECGGFDPAIYWLCLECAGKEGKSFDEAMAELAAYWGGLPSIERDSAK
jgi:hypothetical protein